MRGERELRREKVRKEETKTKIRSWAIIHLSSAFFRKTDEWNRRTLPSEQEMSPDCLGLLAIFEIVKILRVSIPAVLNNNGETPSGLCQPMIYLSVASFRECVVEQAREFEGHKEEANRARKIVCVNFFLLDQRNSKNCSANTCSAGGQAYRAYD